MARSMTEYLTALITEKGHSVEDEIKIEGQFGLTWQHLIEFIETQPSYHSDIKSTLCRIDFVYGDVFHYLTHLANGMIAATQGD